jgi:hypothetical protein
MAEVEVVKWNKTLPNVTKPDIIRFQIMVHCYMEKTPNISPALLDCLTLLGVLGSAELTAFCEMLTEKGIFKSMQSSRNAIARLYDKSLLIKEGRNKKRLSIHPSLKIQNTGNILVDIKCFSPNKETVKSNGAN